LAITEILLGTYYGSISLGAVGFYSLFDCIALGINISSLVISKQRISLSYTYGIERLEILAAFSNAIFMILMGIYLIEEAIEKILELPSYSTNVITIISLISVIVHSCGVLFFQNQMIMRGESILPTAPRSSFSQKSSYFIDVIPSLSTFISSILIQALSWYWLDASVTCFTVLILFQKAYPVVIECGRILLQSVPLTIKHIIEQNLRDASTVEGVLEIHNTHFWTCSPGVYVGSLYVRVRNDCNEQSVLRQIRAIYGPYIRYLTIQVEKWNV